jgi:membrane protease YdiL (CAAX protease family)
VNVGIADHVIAFIIVAVAPISAVWSYGRWVAAMRADARVRRRGYQTMIAQQWLAVAVVLAVWFALGRERAAIGLDVPAGIQTLVGLAITIAVVVGLHLQARSVRRGGDAAIAALRAQIGPIQDLLPRTASEHRWFRGLSITAGVCEEILYRGFIIAYGSALIGTWPAVVTCAVTFGLAHLYQGRANALKAFVGALLGGALVVACDTLLWAMIVHAAFNLHGGMLGRLALESER